MKKYAIEVREGEGYPWKLYQGNSPQTHGSLACYKPVTFHTTQELLEEACIENYGLKTVLASWKEKRIVEVIKEEWTTSRVV